MSRDFRTFAPTERAARQGVGAIKECTVKHLQEVSSSGVSAAKSDATGAFLAQSELGTSASGWAHVWGMLALVQSILATLLAH